MLNYDFQILQPNEFECLTRDLLQKKEDVFVESFTPGKDGGIDLRFAKIKGGKAIVQAKRVKDYPALIKALKKETSKVRALKPERYILSTSVGLTPANKEDIKVLFAPYIKETSDILGRDDLNNLLGQNHDIEKQYYKLWLGSTAVLEDILNKRINNWTSIEMDAIRREVATYVMNDSFNQALEILSKHRYVVISGIPGIGKTTLSRMLVNYLLSDGYEEFVMLQNIEDAAQKLTEGKKQIFFFDDFLGATFFEGAEKGFGNRLVAFIDKVKHEPDKLFVLSTREYILAEAMQTYEIFSTKNIELAKCVLNLSHYTESIRARILYNHLAMAELPTAYIKALLTDHHYLRIVRHINFNPRIIETFLNSELCKKVDPEKFVALFIDFFDRPNAVWEMAFKQLKPLAQYSLLVRMSMGEGKVLLSDWYQAVKCFVAGTKNDLRLLLNDLAWKETQKIIEGTFVLTRHQDDDYVVQYLNPSVYDFLLEWTKGLNDDIIYILRHSYYSEQLYSAFSDTGYPSFFDYGRIKLHESIYPELIEAYKRHLRGLHFCVLKEKDGKLIHEPQNVIDFLLRMERSFGVLFKTNPTILVEVATQELFEDTNFSLLSRMNLFDKIPDEVKEKLDLEHLSATVLKESEQLDDYVNTVDLLKITKTGMAALEDDEYLKKVEVALEWELENADSVEKCNQISESLSLLADNMPGLDEGTWEGAINEVLSGFPGEQDYDDDFSRDFSVGRGEDNEKYEEMFTSLLEVDG